MNIKVGFAEIDSESLERVGQFWDVEEIDASKEYLFQAPGEHYTLFKSKESDTWFLHCKTYRRISSGYPIVDAARSEEDKLSGERKYFTECMVRIPKDFAELIIKKDSLKSDDPNLGHGGSKNTKAREALMQLNSSYNEFVCGNPAFKTVSEDLKRDMNELEACFLVNANRAALAMAGRIMELLLKSYLGYRERKVEDGWMVGRLLTEHEALGEYSDPTLKNVWNIINHQRITGVHAKEKTPIPSGSEVLMVVYALSSAIERLGNRTAKF
jgi:hypothetical protein